MRPRLDDTLRQLARKDLFPNLRVVVVGPPVALRHAEPLGVRRQAPFAVTPTCGHSGRCVFTDEVALPVLMPKG